MHNAIRAALRGVFNRNKSGLLVPVDNFNAKGLFEVSVNGGAPEPAHNLVTLEGRNHTLEAELGGGAQVPTWYIALFAGNVTPAAGWTAANFDANATEFTNFDEGVRQEYDEGAATAGAIDNDGNEAEFTVSAGGGTVYGAALISNSVVGATTGTLFSAARFATVKNLDEGDVIRVKYTVSLTSSS